jgi:hypothetical protein
VNAASQPLMAHKQLSTGPSPPGFTAAARAQRVP